MLWHRTRMAHELLIENGKAAMFYVDAAPCHGLGTPLKTPPTSEEAIRAANLDWQVAKVPLSRNSAIRSWGC